MKGITRYCRLPVGSNNKAKYVEQLGKPFQHRLDTWNPGLTYTVDTIAEAYGLDLTPPKAAAYTARAESPAWANEVLPKLSERGPGGPQQTRGAPRYLPVAGGPHGRRGQWHDVF